MVRLAYAFCVFQLVNDYFHQINSLEWRNDVKTCHIIPHRPSIFCRNVDCQSRGFVLSDPAIQIHDIIPDPYAAYAACEKQRVLLAHDRENSPIKFLPESPLCLLDIPQPFPRKDRLSIETGNAASCFNIGPSQFGIEVWRVNVQRSAYGKVPGEEIGIEIPLSDITGQICRMEFSAAADAIEVFRSHGISRNGKHFVNACHVERA